MWERHRDDMKRLLLSLTRDIDLTDDLLQETYLHAQAGMAAYRDGVFTLYLTVTFLNDQDHPLTSLSIASNLVWDQVYIDGIAAALMPEGKKPLADGNEVDSYLITLPRAVASGEHFSVLTVILPTPGLHAEKSEDGKFRFHWSQCPAANEDCAYIQAIRLPAGARLLTADPPPSDTRGNGVLTLLWRQLLPPLGIFSCNVEYRLDEENSG
jgi:hypothetical protein